MWGVYVGCCTVLCTGWGCLLCRVLYAGYRRVLYVGCLRRVLHGVVCRMGMLFCRVLYAGYSRVLCVRC